MSEDLLKLNLGAAGTKIPGFLSVDISEGFSPDVVAGIDNLPFNKSSVATIYASHVLEHFLPSDLTGKNKRQRIVDLLSYWRSFLAPGGEIYLGVPNLDVLIELYKENIQNSSIRDTVLDVIFGGQRNQYDIHYYGFSRAYLEELLVEAGFVDISLFNSFVNDETSHKILQKDVSLNIKARNGGGEYSSKNSLEINQLTPVEDDLTMFKRAADERLSGLLEQKKYIEYLESEIGSIKKSRKRLIRLFFETFREK